MDKEKIVRLALAGSLTLSHIVGCAGIEALSSFIGSHQAGAQLSPIENTLEGYTYLEQGNLKEDSLRAIALGQNIIEGKTNLTPNQHYLNMGFIISFSQGKTQLGVLDLRMVFGHNEQNQNFYKIVASKKGLTDLAQAISSSIDQNDIDFLKKLSEKFPEEEKPVSTPQWKDKEAGDILSDDYGDVPNLTKDEMSEFLKIFYKVEQKGPENVNISNPAYTLTFFPMSLDPKSEIRDIVMGSGIDTSKVSWKSRRNYVYNNVITEWSLQDTNEEYIYLTKPNIDKTPLLYSSNPDLMNKIKNVNPADLLEKLNVQLQNFRPFNKYLIEG